MKSETLIIGGDSLRLAAENGDFTKASRVIVIQPHVFKSSMDPLRSKKRRACKKNFLLRS